MAGDGSGGGGGEGGVSPSMPRTGHERGPYTGDDRKFVELLERDMLDRKLAVKWDDIASLHDAKRVLQEVRVYL